MTMYLKKLESRKKNWLLSIKNENKLKVNDIEAKFVVSKTCHGLSVSSDPEAGSHVTDSVSLPANSYRLDSVYPFKGDSFDISVTIEDFKSDLEEKHKKLELFFTGAQPKAGTGLKMQTVSFFQRYIVRDISLTEIYRWLIEILSAILKSTRHGERL